MGTNKRYNEYDLSGEYGIGYCTNTGREFYFDLEDYDKIKEYCWYEHEPVKGFPVLQTSIYISPKKCHIQKFWQVLGLTSYDHINHNPFDNRKANLRPCTQHQNVFNSQLAKNNTSGVTGVSFHHGAQKWRARIMLNRREKHLGLFDDFSEAVRCRLLAEQKYFGDFAPQKHLYKDYGIEEE